MDSLRKARAYNDDIGYQDDEATKAAFISTWFGSSGPVCRVTPPFRCDYGININVGDNFYANYDCVVIDCAKVKIGANVFLGPAVHIYTATHPLDAVERRSVESALPVTIGNDVWIGGKASVLPGVEIGDGCVIGAGAVVNRSIPPYSLAVGCPARVVKRLEGKAGSAGAGGEPPAS
ncbi:unnamed protein product [Ostreobium quekettii]|uniref:Maltose O-acetyltransferase n=1 Tax=Ostreobium quekettii TaxID=121088 RepID=A0A8S1ISF6_9CHLO|nr:unnamed protein product [Ostreobium quekettii]CAD7701190.1 unnamed protein product [Ostreobium quekettii]|eukprot:evm.model.scf_9.12 EVM.evm.TU.scf_9.12   scf_9:181066-181596(-)